jgi:starch-binding outer membrane protein, SusD/RagB family
MSLLRYSVRRAAVAAIAIAVPALFAACDAKQELLGIQQPQVIGPDNVTGATGAAALRVGALGSFEGWVMGGGGNSSNIAMFGDLLTDEWKSGDTFAQHNEADQRIVQTNNSVLAGEYGGVQTARGRAQNAIDALRQFSPELTGQIAEMYFLKSYAELILSEDFCNGIPFGSTVNGVVTYTQPVTNKDGLTMAVARLDSALGLATGTDAFAKSVHSTLEIAKARALVDLGQFSAAAAVVADVPTNFQYLTNFSQTTRDNQEWVGNGSASVARFVVGDSFDIVAGQKNLIKNAIPFASAGDPRVPVNGSTTGTTKSIDVSTPWVGLAIWGRDDAYPVLSGIDARLIQGEAQLNAGDYTGMMATLNALRAASQTIGTYKVPVMPALTTTPATKDAAINLFFREKAFWQFGRGYRLGDMRRLIRVYGRTQDQVFPTGVFFKNGTYGTDVNLPVTDGELTNPNFHGCIDRNA